MLNRNLTVPFQPRCRSCGGSRFRAWYPVDEGQGLEGIEPEFDLNGKFAGFTFDYDGCTTTGDCSGPNDEYWCLDCQDNATTLEELCGVAWALAAEPDHDPDSGLPSSLHAEIQAALSGDSNDAEHDALASVASHFGVQWTDPEEAD
jgi:hypothetical protein